HASHNRRCHTRQCFPLTRPLPPTSPLTAYTTLFRSARPVATALRAVQLSNTDTAMHMTAHSAVATVWLIFVTLWTAATQAENDQIGRATSELQSLRQLVCRLLLDKKHDHAVVQAYGL